MPPTRKYVYRYLDAWYKTHHFEKSVLVFVFDGRRCPHKTRNIRREQEIADARAEKDRATTFQGLEKALRKLMTVDADMLFWVTKWVEKKENIFMFGAPYEADAQLVQLERQGVIDAIITNDGTFACLLVQSLAYKV